MLLRYFATAKLGIPDRASIGTTLGLDVAGMNATIGMNVRSGKSRSQKGRDSECCVLHDGCYLVVSNDRKICGLRI